MHELTGQCISDEVVGLIGSQCLQLRPAAFL